MANSDGKDDTRSIDWKAFFDALAKAGTSKPDLPADQLISAPLAYEALEDAADELSVEYGQLIKVAGYRILVTSTLDLASASAAYLDVASAISSLDAAAQVLLLSPIPGAVDEAATAGLVAAASLVAEIVPSLLSLLSPQLSVRMSKVEANDLAAAAAVVASLSTMGVAATFVHDSFRRVPEGGLLGRLKELGATRLDLFKRMAAAPDPGKPAFDALIKAIDAFAGSLKTVPAGAARSPLATALLAEPLYAEGEGALTHALFVKSEGGHSLQTIDDRPFFFQDKVSVFTEVSITFLFVEIATGKIVASDTVSGKANGFGTIGQELTISRPDASRTRRR